MHHLATTARRLSVADRHAAELAFFLPIALVPFVACAVAVADRLVAVDLGIGIGQVLSAVLPSDTKVDAQEVLAWARSTVGRGWLTAGFAIATWTAFRFMALCSRTLAVAMGAPEPVAWSWRQLARALLLLVVWSVALAGTAAVLGWSASYADSPGVAGKLLRAAGTGAILVLALATTYRVVAGRRGLRRPVWPAACVVAVGWLAASFGFSKLVSLLWSAARDYGTLGALVLFSLWAYVVAWILLLGGFLVGPVGGRASARPRRRS